MNVTPVILHRKSTHFEGIYEVLVEIRDQNGDVSEENRNMIVKEISCGDKESSLITLKPFFAETMISYNFNCPTLNSAQFYTVKNNICSLFFEKAVSNCKTYKFSNNSEIFVCFKSLILGISHLHQRRILHGDIKASNALVFEDQIKVSDFGLSCFILEDNSQIFPNGVKMYTVTHKPPEVWFSNEWGFPADIFALGCTFYEILYKESYFPIQDTERSYMECQKDWMNNKKNSTYNPINIPDNYNENVKFNQIIDMMINPNPELRPTIFQLLVMFDTTFEKFTNVSISLPIPISRKRIKPRSDSLASCSPESVSEIFISNVSEFVTEKFYVNNKSEKFKKKLKTFIMTFSQSKNDTYIDLVSSLYEYVNIDVSEINILTLQSCIIIINMIIFRTIPPFYILNKDDITEINRIVKKVRM